jgi:DnaJ-class molecular chaperone
MKYFKVLFLALAFIAASITLTSCGGGGDENTEKQGKEYTSAYVCPMHCEGSGSEAEGKCPVCGMDYVKKEKHQADGHKH